MTQTCISLDHIPVSWLSELICKETDSLWLLSVRALYVYLQSCCDTACVVYSGPTVSNRIQVFTSFSSLRYPPSVLGRSIVIHNHITPSVYLACANINPAILSDTVVRASFPVNGNEPDDVFFRFVCVCVRVHVLCVHVCVCA